MALQAQGLKCRDERDCVLVALLLLKSLTAADAIGDVGIWWESLRRATEGLSLAVRRNEGFEWQD